MGETTIVLLATLDLQTRTFMDFYVREVIGHIYSFIVIRETTVSKDLIASC